MNLDTELKKEYRSWENWLDQFSNVIYSLLWSVGFWLILSTTLIGLASIFLVLFHDGSEVTFIDFQTIFTSIVIFCSGISSVLVFGFGASSKFRNVFKDIARDRISRYNSIKHEFESQIDTTESLLLKYKLVTKEQIEERHNETK